MHFQRHDYDRNYEPGDMIVEALERDAQALCSRSSIWTNTLTDLQVRSGAAQRLVLDLPRFDCSIGRIDMAGTDLIQ